MTEEHRLEPDALELLRSATRSCHVKLAGSPAMRRLFDPAYSLVEYRAHLGRLLGLFGPLERVVARVANPLEPTDVLGKATALRADLRTMGSSAQDIDALEQCRHLPDISQAGLPGYRYVVLGSMLGGKIIVERLRAVLGPDASFAFYGPSRIAEESWAALCLDLEHNRILDVPAACATAVAIFELYAGWVSDSSQPVASSE